MTILGSFVNWKSSYLPYRIIDFYPSYSVGQIEIGFGRKFKKNEIDNALELLEKCLSLIEVVFPEKYNDLKRDVVKIYVKKSAATIDDGNDVKGSFNNDIKSIVLQSGMFNSNPEKKGRLEFISSTILHEAQHARLHRIGFSSNRETLGRQERICYTLQRRLGVKVNASEVVEFCNYALSVDLEKYYSSAAYISREIENIVNREIPEWLKKYAVRKILNNYKQTFAIGDIGDINSDLKKWNDY